jgi:hypothetical protein
VFWLFLAQVLSADRTCRETLCSFLGRLALQGKTASPGTAGYCKGRRRLPQKDLDERLAGLTRNIRSVYGSSGLWFGHPVKVVDGSSLSMPDTPSNQAVYPQPKSAKPGCGFPVMRITALFGLGTGVLLGLAQGALRIHERTLFRSLWNLLERRDVLLADRGFCSYADLCLLRDRGVDAVMRNHPRRHPRRNRCKRLGRNDYLVRWLKPQIRPDWVDPALWDRLPDTLLLRQITFSTRLRCFRTRSVTLVTTLLDAERFPTSAFPDLYRRRWQAELFLRDIKITVGMDILRCKTPDMIHKELTMHLIAYNLIRLTILEAAAEHETSYVGLSFKGTLSAVRQWAPNFLAAPPTLLPFLWKQLLRCVAADGLPHRPNRLQPRARKRRPKNYQLLTGPRHLFKETPHRSKYTKTLS